MKHFEILGIAFAALCVLGVRSTSAFATLPDVSALAFPLHLNFADNGKTPTKFETLGGTLALQGEGVLLLMLAKALGSLGSYLMLFLRVTLSGGESCNTAGDAKGEVLLPENEYHVVYPSLSPLTLGVAFLVKEFSFKCGLVEVKVRGCMLAKITEPSTEAETTLATVVLLGTGGKNELTEFDNAEGTGKVKCILELNVGAGFAQADVSVGETVHLVALESGMFKISPI
jgi:hypothetical protein